MKLSVIIPLYNEEATVSEILKRVKSADLPKQWKKEIIVIDDKSTDSSKLRVQKLKIKDLRLYSHKTNLGKGAAIRTGFKKSTGEVVVIQDADLEYDPRYFQKLLKVIVSKKSQVVYGTRLKKYPLVLWGKNKTPIPAHWLGNKLLTLVTNVLYGSNLSDMETCYKMMTRNVLKSLRLTADKFDIEPEITAKILKQGFKIIEVPIKVKPRTRLEGKKIHWTDGFSAIWTLVKYRFTK